MGKPNRQESRENKMKCERCEKYIPDDKQPLFVSAKMGHIGLFLCRDCNIQAMAGIKESLSIFMRRRVDLTIDTDEMARDTNEEQ